MKSNSISFIFIMFLSMALISCGTGSGDNADGDVSIQGDADTIAQSDSDTVLIEDNDSAAAADADSKTQDKDISEDTAEIPDAVSDEISDEATDGISDDAADEISDNMADETADEITDDVSDLSDEAQDSDISDDTAVDTDVAPEDPCVLVDCAQHAVCVVENSKAVCKCITDFVLDNGSCINEKTVDCNTNASLPANAGEILSQVNITYTTAGGWTAVEKCQWTCNNGYTKNGNVCDDTNECATPGICETAKCKNLTGTYECYCDFGYNLISGSLCSAKVIVFIDANLAACVRETIAKSTGDILFTDVSAVTDLNCPEKNIEDISGLEYFRSLQQLDLGKNNLDSILPLADLKSLSVVTLSENHYLYDMSPLAGLTSISSLDLHGNMGIEDISALANLTSLAWANLSINAISDLLPLSGLSGLSQLNLAYNAITDVQPLAGLNGLSSLGLKANRVSKIAPLAGLTGLDDIGLDIEGDCITDMSSIQNLIDSGKVWGWEPEYQGDCG